PCSVLSVSVAVYGSHTCSPFSFTASSNCTSQFIPPFSLYAALRTAITPVTVSAINFYFSFILYE
ncbi:hypothetical protein OFM97_30305, partial [Escherichia coli]|nr:hypothetical protein [Escherichia coli]